MRGLSAVVSLLATLVAPLAIAAPPVVPQQDWRQLTTQNFHVIGNAGERDLKRAAQRLEQFRQALGILFPKAILATSAPTTVIVFRGQKEFEPFQPLYNGKPNTNVGGYFVKSTYANYVAMKAANEENLGIVYHEYVHLVLNNASTGLPVWFNEGLAEYYRTFEVGAGGTQAFIGRVVEHHVRLLREQWLPLPTLIAVDKDSPHYNEGDKASIFYAESWALVHYLLNGHQGQYSKQVGAFVMSLAGGDDLEKACAGTLKITTAALERELRQYVQQQQFQAQVAKFSERLGGVDDLPVTPLANASAYAALGDLLFRMQRAAEARPYLEEALTLDPALAEGHAALGHLLLADGKRDEARRHLKSAAASGDAPWTAHFVYAMLLAEGWRGDTDPEVMGAMRRSLQKTIELQPSFPDAYIQLAWVESQSEAGIPEAIKLARKGLELAPGNDHAWLLLAQIYAMTGDLGQARPIALRVTRSTDPGVASEARGLLSTIDGELRREAASPVRLRPDATASDARSAVSTASSPSPSPAAPTPATAPERMSAMRMGPNFRARRTGEQQTAGALARIDCASTGLTLVVRQVAGETRFHADSWDRIEFISYRDDLRGQISCGRQTDPVVIVTFTPASSGPAKAIAVEFVPEGYEPKP